MAIPTTAPADELFRGPASAAGRTDTLVAAAGAVSWGAIAAGAAAAASLSLILLLLGVGLGLSSVSPWAHEGMSAANFGVSTILWLTLTQVVASVLGGYLAGRLRTRWSGVDADEVYFRDTAHGFLAWAVASLATAALLTSAIGSILSVGSQAGASVVGGATSAATTAAATSARSTAASDGGAPMGYFIDSLFRRSDATAPATPPAPDAATSTDANQRSSAATAAEVTRIFANVGRADSALPADDVRYVAQLVAQRTGLSPQDAEKRVTDTYARAQTQVREMEASAKNAADKARKASAYGALWLFVSLLVGAFVASLAATFGGRQRDR